VPYKLHISTLADGKPILREERKKNKRRDLLDEIYMNGQI